MRRLHTTVMMLAIAVGSASVGCGDDNPSKVTDAPKTADASKDAPGDGPGSGSNATFTTFVINLVTNVGPNETPAAFASFATLPDPDGADNNTSAYSSLF